MNVSKISILNIHKAGVSPFRGDTPVSENNIKQRDKSKEFLKGSLYVSAGILALALAGRAGVFTKLFGNNTSSINRFKLQPDDLKDKPIAEYIKTKESLSIKSIYDVYDDKFSDNVINPLLLKSKFDYTKFDINSDVSAQNKFFSKVTSEIDKMSYEDQYDEFKFLMEFLGGFDASKLKGSVLFDLGSYKRDNPSRCDKEVMALLDKKPELADTLFYRYTRQKYLRGGEYDTFNRLNTHGEKAAFFTNTFNKILKSGDNLDAEFDKYLNFIKTLPAEEVKYHILFTPGQFPIDKNLDMVKKVISFIQENPDYKDGMVRDLLAYQPDSDFSYKLAGAKFRPYEEIQGAYDKHFENILDIRKELLDSGLMCDETSRRILRDDWMNFAGCKYNKFNLAFQYSPRLPEFKKVSFEYDISHGLTREEADEIIKYITDRHNTCKGTQMDVVMGMKLEEMVEKINNAVVK